MSDSIIKNMLQLMAASRSCLASCLRAENQSKVMDLVWKSYANLEYGIALGKLSIEDFLYRPPVRGNLLRAKSSLARKSFEDRIRAIDLIISSAELDFKSENYVSAMKKFRGARDELGQILASHRRSLLRSKEKR